MGKRTKTGTTDDSSHSKGSEISHTTNRRSSQNHQKLKSPTENRENTKMVENEHNESETGVPLSPRSARFNNHLPDGVSRRFVAKNLSQGINLAFFGVALCGES